MTLDSQEKLSIAVLVYFVPAFIISAYVFFRHGFHRQLGWLYLATLSIVRIVGPAIQLSEIDKQTPDVGTLVAVAILNSVGLVPLILALTGMLGRVNQGAASNSRVTAKAFFMIHLICLAALILGIIGGTKMSNYDNPSDLNSGNHLREGAAILLLVVYVLLYAITASCFFKMRAIYEGDRRLVYAALAAAPFLLVRLIYSVCSAFDSHSKLFGFQSANVYVMAFMQYLMEFIVVTIFLAAGLTVPALKGMQTQQESSGWQMGNLRGQNKPAAAYQVNTYQGSRTGDMEHGATR